MSDTQTALVFRHLEDLSDSDKNALTEFAQQTGLTNFVAVRRARYVSCPYGLKIPAPLSIHLQQQHVTIEFQPNDFTQVNSELIRQW